MQSKRRIRIDFADFGGLDKNNNFFIQLLSPLFDIEINDKPDLLFFGDMGHVNRLHSCRKVYWTGESNGPDWNAADFAITSHHLEDERHFRLPFYVYSRGGDASALIRKPDEVDRIIAEKRKFCSAVISNANTGRSGERIKFFEKLSSYKRIDSGGKWGNNIGGPLPMVYEAKFDFIRQYKFNLCYENKAQPGYVTEKLTDAMVERCVPIYWGAPDVVKDFNPLSMLCRHDYPDDESFIRHILEVDQNETLYRQYLQQPYFHNNVPNENFDLNRIRDFLVRVIESDCVPVERLKKPWHRSRWRLAKRSHF